MEQKAYIAIARDPDEACPVPGLWPALLASSLNRDLETGTRSVRYWLDKFRVAYADFPNRTFKNINTMSDLQMAEQTS
jgi:molybdopterin-guanine dinucleotide biosynthesis protein A